MITHLSQIEAAVEGTLTVADSAVATALADVATESKQDDIITALDGISTAANQTTANTTLSAIETALGPISTAANQATANTTLSAIQTAVETPALPSDAATESKQDDIIFALDAVATSAKQDTIIALLENHDDWETIAASQTDQVMGATGAAGDILSTIVVIPATTSPGNVSIKDGSGSLIPVFVGGADSLSNNASFTIPLNIASKTGAWKVTTGGNVSVIATGSFT